MWNWLKHLQEGSLELLFPAISRCPFCEEPGEAEVICPACQREIAAYHNWPRCQHCGRFFPEPAGENRYCLECSKGESSLALIRSVIPYQELARNIIANFKYRQERRLAEFLAPYLVQVVERENWHPQAVVPVPMSAQKLRVRGFNQAALLAAEIAQGLHLPCQEVLEKVRDTHSQAELSRLERLANLQGTVRAKDLSSLAGKEVLLVDDILTTGSTLETSAAVLRQGGVKKVFGLVLASGILHY